MRDIETRLRALEVEWPSTPELAAPVMARLPAVAPAQAGPRIRGVWRRRRLAVAVVLALLVPAAAAVAFPSARDDVLEWLGVKGATVTRSNELPPAEPLRLELLGRRVSLAEAERIAGFRTARPAALGAPDHVRVDAATDTITLVHGDVLVSQTPGRLRRELLGKVVTGQDVLSVEVGGERALFISGRPHVVFYEHRDGSIREARGRLAGDVLVFGDRDRLVRIEARRLPLGRALEIARSML